MTERSEGIIEQSPRPVGPRVAWGTWMDGA